jgi:HIRAN domain
MLRRLFQRTPKPAAAVPVPVDAPAPALTESGPAAPHTVMLTGGMEVQVVGESSYQAALSRICGGKTGQSAELACVASLVPEPENAKDTNAIAVLIDGLKVGYLSREDAEGYQPLMRTLSARGLTGQCEALIKGGWKRPHSEGQFGVVLDLEDPDHALP